jgi:DNA polymerase III delta subunit
MDKAYNSANASVTFTVETSIQSMMSVLTSLYNDGKITSASVYKGLMDKLKAAAQSTNPATKINQLNAFIKQVKAQSGKSITLDAATLLIKDTQWLIAHLK